ncbi:MAG: hypothetical protein AB1473_17180 [Thermodesulfobacteriota bacterium]
MRWTRLSRHPKAMTFSTVAVEMTLLAGSERMKASMAGEQASIREIVGFLGG